MKKADEEWGRATLEALATRAATAAAMPMTVHSEVGGTEEQLFSGTPARQACRWLHGYAEGREACAASRAKAVAQALRRRKPAPFVCHMGFACVTVPVETDAGRAALTAGPFIPAEAPHSAVSDAEQALRQLGLHDGGALPFSLDDIAVTPVSAAHACAEWLAEDLAAIWARPATVSGESEDGDSPPEGGRTRSGRAAVTRTGREAALCASAMAGDWDGVRRGAMAALGGATAVAPSGVLRARALALAAGALEAAEAAKAPKAAACWKRLDALASELQLAGDARGLAKAVTGFLKPLKSAPRTGGGDAMLAAVHKIVTRDLAQGVSLEDAARELGVHPTAVTHRLQRTVGLSYSEYVGRLRVEKAKELLGRTKLGVGEIGRRVGIGDVSNFAKLFRRHEGMSPGDYREKRGRRQ